MNIISIYVNGTKAEVGEQEYYFNGNSDNKLFARFSDEWVLTSMQVTTRYRKHGVEHEVTQEVVAGLATLGAWDDIDFLSVSFSDGTHHSDSIIIPCMSTIKDFSGKAEEPHEDAYDYLMGLLHQKVG